MKRLVVGAAIVDDVAQPREILIAHRAGKGWEFPGGKVEPGESPQQALVREIREELGVKICVGDEIVSPGGVWPINDALEMRMFWATAVGQTMLLDGTHDELRVVTASELPAMEWLPADVAVAQAISQQLGH